MRIIVLMIAAIVRLILRDGWSSSSLSLSEMYPAVAGYRSTRQAHGTATMKVQDVKMFTFQRTTDTEGSVQKAGNPNLRARDTLFIRLPLLLYVPDGRRQTWYFPLTDTAYCTMKILMKDTARYLP